MVSSVYWEWELLFITIKLGIKLALFYDILCIFRLLISHSNLLVSIEDFFFWIYAALLIFRMQLEQSDGVLRGFSILGMILGMFLYHKLLGEPMVFLAEKGIGIAKRRLTESTKMFKMKMCKHCDVFEKNRSKHDRKKNPGKKKEAKQSGNAASNDGSAGNDAGGSGK